MRSKFTYSTGTGMALAYVTGYIILYGVQFTVEIKKKPKKNLDFHRRMFFFFFCRTTCHCYIIFAVTRVLDFSEKVLCALLWKNPLTYFWGTERRSVYSKSILLTTYRLIANRLVFYICILCVEKKTTTTIIIIKIKE